MSNCIWIRRTTIIDPPSSQVGEPLDQTTPGNRESLGARFPVPSTCPIRLRPVSPGVPTPLARQKPLCCQRTVANGAASTPCAG